jgi:hypothetical protein
MATVTEEIDININTNADQAAEGFKSLRAQIRETTIALQALEAQGQTNTDEFRNLRAQLDQLNDTAEVSAFRAGQLDDQLAALPGVAGQAGSAFKQFNDTLLVLSKNPILLTLTVLVGVFLAFKKSLEATAEGQATLNRISTAFSKILGPILATIEAVALPLFEGLAFVLEKVGQGFAFVAEKLGISQQKIAEASSGNKDFAKTAEEAAKAAKDAADKAAAEAEKAEAEAKARREKYAEELKKSEEIIFQARIALMSRRDAELQNAARAHEANMVQLRKTGGRGANLETERYLKERQEINEKYNKIEQEFVRKTFEDIFKIEDSNDERQLKREIKTAELKGKLTLETEKEFLDRSIILRRNQQADVDAAVLADFDKQRAEQRKNATNVIKFDEETGNLRLNVLKSLEERRAIIVAEQNNELLELQKKYADQQALNDFALLNDQIANLDRLNAELDGDFDKDLVRLEEKEKLIAEAKKKELLAAEGNLQKQFEVSRVYAEKENALEVEKTRVRRAELETRQNVFLKYADLTGQIGRLISQNAGESKDLALAGLAIESAAALATIGISTFKNASKAGFTTPLGIAEIAAGVVAAAAVAINYSKGVQEINKVPVPGGGNGGGAGAPSISAPTIQAPEVNLFTATQQGTTAGIVAGSIRSNNSADRPIKVYVTSNDVTSTQELDRKALNLARL